jgi:hypothetical protein
MNDSSVCVEVERIDECYTGKSQIAMDGVESSIIT